MMHAHAGEKIGQAAVFDSYELEDGTVVKIEGLAASSSAAGEVAFVPTEEDLRVAEESVQQWAEYVRGLKEQQGKGNADPEVQEAVAQLKAAKESLVAWQELMAAAAKSSGSS